MMNRTMKKLTAWLLALMMVISLYPVSVFSESGTEITSKDEFSDPVQIPEQQNLRNAEAPKITVTFDPTTDPAEPLAPQTIEVEEGAAIGDQLPAVPEVPGYTTKWVDQETGETVNADTEVTEPFTAVVDKEKIYYTVTFVQENGEQETRTTSIDDGFAVNDLPEVTLVTNKVGVWVYPGTTNEFTVGTVISEDLTVNAYYVQNVFTVTFMSDGSLYETTTTATGATIILPSDPIKAGATFSGWFTEADGAGTEYTAESTVNEDLTLYAYFKNQVKVSFIVRDDEGNIISEKSQYFVNLSAGDQITTLPDEPFVEGKLFDYWKNETTGETVTVGTVVTESFNAVAVFKEISSYELTVKYFYKNDAGERVDIGTQVYSLVEADFPYTVTAPGYTIATQVTDEPTYYPSRPTITVEIGDFSNGVRVEEDEYVEADANYKVGHYLKDLTGGLYTTQIEIIDKVGVKNSVVTPDVNSYAYAEYETRDENVTITGDAAQELKVYYTRKDFTLSYNVGAGDYIDAVTKPYGSEITLPATATRAGYTFAGWYEDSDCTQAADSPYKLEGNTTIYAKWEAAQSEYKIVYMIENADDDGFSYLATVTKTAPTDSSVTMTAATAGADGTRPGELDTVNFTFKESSTETISADGTTVVIVKYSRNVYTITWQGSGFENYNNVTGNATWHTGRGNASLTAKYGANISVEWASTFNTPHPNWCWNFLNTWSSENNEKKFTSLDVMPSGNKTVYHWCYTTTKTQNYNYWLENYESTVAPAQGQPNTKTYNGRTYGLLKRVTVHYNWLDDADYPSYANYTQPGFVRSDNKTGTGNNNNGTYGNNTVTVDFYYNAYEHPLTFYNYDGTLISTQQVTLGNNIYAILNSSIPDEPMEGATWLGWFTDAEHENSFDYDSTTKMPAGLVLYGNFEFPTRTVEYDSQGGSDVASETDEYGFYATKPEDPTKDHYTFQGWYTKADDTGSPYDWNKPVTENITLYAHWTQDTISYTVHYYEQGTTTKVLDDKVVSNPDFTEGQSITENAATIAGHVADNSSVTISLTFSEEDNTITFYYHTIPSELSYTVHYVLRDHPEIKVAESKTITVPGTMTNVLELAVEVDTAYLATQTSDAEILNQRYKPDQTSKELQLGLDNNVITFEYVPYTSAKITVNYLDMDGKSIHDSDVTFVEKGDTYTVQNKAPDGYVYHHAYLAGTTTAPQNTYQITGDEGSLVINKYYQKKLIILANNKAKTYDGTALASSFANTSDYTVTGNMRGDTLTSVEFEGSQTDAGNSTTTPKNAQIAKGSEAITDPETYYSIIYVPASLTVNPVSVYISINADQWNTHSGSTGGPNYYTGETFNVGFTNPGKQRFNDDTSKSAYINITSTQRALFKETYGDAIWSALYGTDGALISQKDAGTYTVSGTTIKAKLPGFSSNYSVTAYARDSFLKIEPLPLTITTASAEKAYDGTALTKTDGATLDHNYWTANIGGVWTAATTAEAGAVTLGTGDKITFNVTGSQTVVGDSENTYSIDWGDTKSTNYTVTATTGTLSVTKAELKVTVKDIEKTYNGENQTGRAFVTSLTGTGETIETDDYKVEGLGAGDILTITYTPAQGKDVDGSPYTGAFATSFTLTDADNADATGNYKSTTFTPGNLTITKATMTVTAVNYDGTYDGDNHEGGATPSVTEGTTVQYSTDGGENWSSTVPSITDVGTVNYKVKATNANYTDATADGTLNVTKKDVTVTVANADDVVYDGSEHTGITEYTFDGIVDKETATITYTPATGTNVNTYTGSYGTDFAVAKEDGSDSTGNYNLTTKTPGNLTITKATMTVTAVNYDGTYDGDNHEGGATPSVTEGTTVQYSTDGGENWSSTVPSITDVGTVNYQVKATNANYTDATADGTLNVTKKDVTVTVANADDVVYDGSEHTGITEYTFDGIVDKETATITYTPATGTNVNTYEGSYGTDFAVKKSDNSDSTGNYNLTTKTAGKLTIMKATMTVEAVDYDKPYDGAAHEGGATPSVTEGTTVQYSTDGGTTWTNDKPSITDVGTVTYKVKTTNANYEDATDDGTLNVTKKDVTVTVADADDVVYDGEDHTGITEYTFDGIVAGETATITYTPAKGKIVDTYEGSYGTDFAVKKSDNSDSTGNYNLTTKTAGKLTITKATMTVTAVDYEGAYDGAAHEGGATPSVSEGTTVQYSTDGGTTWTADKPSITDFGTVTYKVKATNPNYNDATDEGTLNVTKKEVTVTVADADDTVYDGKEHTGETEYVFNGLVDKETATITYTSAKGTNVDTYTGSYGDDFAAEKADGTDSTNNYTLTEKTPGSLTITKATMTVEAVDYSGKYDGKAHEGGATPEVTDGTTVQYSTDDGKTWSDKVPSIQDFGTVSYQVKATNANYEDATDEGTLKITKLSVTLTSADDRKVYDGEALTNDTVTISGDGFIGDEGATYDVTGTQTLVGSSANAFTYTLKEGTLADNYEITTVEGTLTVSDGMDTGDAAVDDDLVVTKAADQKEYKLGDTVTFNITATNIYAEARTIELSEIEGVTLKESTFRDVGPGKTIETTAEYVITEADILAGKFDNTVTAKAGRITKTAMASVKTEAKKTQMTLEKVTTSQTPEGGYAPGEEITYAITVTNAGNLTITGITVNDELTGGKWTVDSLAPGANQVFETSYVVTDADAEAGSVLNIATATGTSTDPDETEVTPDPAQDPEPTRPAIYTLTVNYLIDGKIINTVIQKLESGTAYDIATPPMEGYKPDIERVSGTLTEDTTVNVVYQIQSYTLTIMYRDQNGNEVAPTYTELIVYNTNYSVQSPTVNGMAANRTTVAETMPARDVTITVFYAPIPEPQAGEVYITIEDFETPLGLGAVGNNAGEGIE